MAVIPTPIGFGVFVTTFLVCRIVQERALRKLDVETKGRLVEAFSDHRIIALLPLAAIGALYFAMTMIDGLPIATLFAIYVPAALVMAVVMQVVVHRKLRAMEIDPEYLRTYSVCRVAMLLALAVLMLTI